MKWFTKSNNAVEETKKKPKGKAITLQLNDKHEPFGTISIERIKVILEEEGFTELQSLYFYMMRDLKISSAILARRQPLLALDYTIKTENEAFNEWLASDAVDLEELINQLSFAVYYGVSLTDIVYTVKDSLLVPDFTLISPRYLYAHKDKQLKKTIDHLYVKQGDKKLFISKLDQDKAVFHKHAIDIGEITDFSLASKLVWYFSLKHIALAHNLQYFDNVATPPLIAKTSGDEDELIETLYQLKSSTVGVFNSDDIIEYLQVNSKADFLSFIEYIDRQITTLILGNTLSTGEGKTGSYSQSKTHEKRQTETLNFDAKKIAKTITAYLNRLEKLNFSNTKGVVFRFDLKEKADLEMLSKVAKNLSDSGFELDAEDIEEKFGFKVVAKNNESANTEPTNATKDNNSIQQNVTSHHSATQQKPYDTLDSKNVDTLNIENALLNSVESIFNDANNYEEAYNNLLDEYVDFDIETLEQALFKAIGNSMLLADVEPR